MIIKTTLTEGIESNQSCRRGAVPQKSFALSASALPPDVRRWLCPAVEVAFTCLGYALGAAWGPIRSKGLSPNQGHSPRIEWLLSAGHSHRGTSGGEAETDPQRTFKAKSRRGYKFALAVLSLGIVLSVFVGYPQSASGTSPNASPNRTFKTQVERSLKAQAAVDRGDLRLRYQPPKKRTAATETHAVGSNRQAIEKLITDLNQRLILPFDIDVVFVDCESSDAFYDPETHEVTLCHQLIDEYYELFAKKLKDKRKLDDAVKAATLATFFHELGHGLVDAWKIPITGREEDAVDQLSTLVLIEATENGEQMAIDGALSFKLYADHASGKQMYWDEHSLDEQRFFDTICLIYGHDMKRHAYLVNDGTLPEERASFCKEDYEKVSRAWHQLLAPYLKASVQSRPKLR